MRKFAFITLNESDNIIDRYDVNIATNISGLGFSLNVSTISTDIEDYISKIVQNKKDISFTIIQQGGYNEYEKLSNWFLANINNTICLEYNNGTNVKYCEGIIVESSFSEKTIYKVLEPVITFRPLTPFFKKITDAIKIQMSMEGKKYPFSYPYCYGVNLVENNEINNIYFKDVPIIITIYGSCTNPHIRLLDENDNTYNEVFFENLYVKENERLIINSAQKKIWLIDSNGNKEDYYFKVSSLYDSYLRAEGSMTSKININFESTDTGYLVGSWRQYCL